MAYNITNPTLTELMGLRVAAEAAWQETRRRNVQLNTEDILTELRAQPLRQAFTKYGEVADYFSALGLLIKKSSTGWHIEIPHTTGEESECK